MDKIVRLDIVDNDVNYCERLLDTFYLVNPDENKLARLRDMIKNRFTEGRFENYTELYEYISANFETVEIDTKEIEW